LLLVVAVGGGCLNQSGFVASTKDGDLSHPAERGSPAEPLAKACGDGGKLDGVTSLARQPYLQQVTTKSAMLGWVTTDGGPARVAVTRPDGSAVTTADAAEEAVITRSAGEHQMWAQLDGLEPDTVYCYALSDSTGALTAPTGFRTAPPADTQRTVRFLAFGDSGGGGSDQLTLRDQMETVPFEMIIHTGDIAYDSGTIREFEDNVFGVYANIFKSFSFWPAAGNHEYLTDNAAPFRAVFALPGDSGEKWYSYDWGPIHFAALDTEADYATQMTWLDQDLAATTLPWKIVYMHRPPYSSGEHGSDLKLRTLLQPVIEKHGVQLVLAGHDHDYERMIPQYSVSYIVTGGGGRGTRPVGTSGFTAFSAEVIHFIYGEVSPDEMVLHAIDGVGREFDSLVIKRYR
jgi:hypothetical protein